MWDTKRKILQVVQRVGGDCHKIRVKIVWPIRDRTSAVSHRLFLWPGSDQGETDGLTAQSLLFERSDQKDCQRLNRKEGKEYK